MSEYNVKVDPTKTASFCVGCDHKILHVICFDPGYFSVVFAVNGIHRVEEKIENSFLRVKKIQISDGNETAIFISFIVEEKSRIE